MLIIYGISLDYVVLQNFVCPFTEFHAKLRFYTVTDGDNDIEIIEFNVTCYLTITFSLNCCKFCNS